MVDHSEPVASDALGQLEVLRHYGHPLCVDGAEVGVFEERHQVGFGCFLEGQHRLALEPDFLLELGGDLPHQSLEGQFADEQVGLHKSGEGREAQLGELRVEGGLTLFWNFRIYRRATVPGLKRWGFLTPETMGADFLAIFWAASCLRGTFCAVDFLAVCLVRAIFNKNNDETSNLTNGVNVCGRPADRFCKLPPQFTNQILPRLK